jgi:hypothetical protein
MHRRFLQGPLLQTDQIGKSNSVPQLCAIDRLLSQSCAGIPRQQRLAAQTIALMLYLLEAGKDAVCPILFALAGSPI